jgi:hypothetical protein
MYDRCVRCYLYDRYVVSVTMVCLATTLSRTMNLMMRQVGWLLLQLQLSRDIHPTSKRYNKYYIPVVVAGLTCLTILVRWCGLLVRTRLRVSHGGNLQQRNYCWTNNEADAKAVVWIFMVIRNKRILTSLVHTCKSYLLYNLTDSSAP